MNNTAIRFGLLATLFYASSAFAFEVRDFRAGLVCTDGKSFHWICHAVSKIHVSGQGNCVYNKKNVPCTWYGFSFRYSDAAEGDKLNCVSTSNRLRNEGNPDGIKKQNITQFRYDIPLKPGKDQYFINLQYSVLHLDSTGKPALSDTHCSYKKRQMFHLKRELVFPTRKSVEKLLPKKPGTSRN